MVHILFRVRRQSYHHMRLSKSELARRVNVDTPHGAALVMSRAHLYKW